MRGSARWLSLVLAEVVADCLSAGRGMAEGPLVPGAQAAQLAECQRLRAALAGRGSETPSLVIDTHANRLLVRRGSEVLHDMACATGSGRRLEAFIEAGEAIPVLPEDTRRFERGALGRHGIYFAEGYLIHGTLYETNLGLNITHGCVRVGEEDLQCLYDTVEEGWPVYVF